MYDILVNSFIMHVLFCTIHEVKRQTGVRTCRPSGAAEEICEILGPQVKVEVPIWSGQNPRSQAVFRRGFLPAHRPILSSLVPSTGQAGANMASMMSDSDFECVAAQGYALGFENSSATDSGPLDMTPTVESNSAALSSQSLQSKQQPGPSAYPESPAHQNRSPNLRTSTFPSSMNAPGSFPRAFPPSTIPPPPSLCPGTSSVLWPHEGSAEDAWNRDGPPRQSSRTAGMAFAGAHDRPARRAVHSRRARLRRTGLSTCVHPDMEDRQAFLSAGPSGASEARHATQAAPRTDQQGCHCIPSAPTAPETDLESWTHLCETSSLARAAAISASHDEEMRDLAMIESFADVFQEESQEENADSDPSPSFGALMGADIAPSAAFFPAAFNGSAPAPPPTAARVARGMPRADNNPFSSGSFGAAGRSSLVGARPGNKIPRAGAMPSSSSWGIAGVRRKSTQMQLPSSFHPEPVPPPPTAPSYPRQTPSPGPAATVVEEPAAGSVPTGRERSHSPVARRFCVGRDPSTRYGNGSPYRGPTARANPCTGTPDRFSQWRGLSPASRTSSSLFSDERASPMPHGSSSEEPSQSPSNAAALMASRLRSQRFLAGDGASSSDVRAERLRLESLELQRTNVHRAIARTVRNRRGARETLMDSSKPTRLQLFGSEATPQGISSTPRTLRMLSSLPSSPDHQSLPAPVPGLGMEASLACEVRHPVCKGDKVIKILEMPMCPCGQRPVLIAQVNAQASPQFEKLGPYLVRIGCCKICKVQVQPVPLPELVISMEWKCVDQFIAILFVSCSDSCSASNHSAPNVQVPSVVDLTKEDVTGTSTDSLLVVSNELHKNVVARQTGTIRAHRARSGTGVLDADATNGDGINTGLMPAGTSCIIEQVLSLCITHYCIHMLLAVTVHYTVHGAAESMCL